MKINYQKKTVSIRLLKVFKTYCKPIILCIECRMHSSFTNVDKKKYKYLSRPTKVINVFVNTRVYKQPGLFVY